MHSSISMTTKSVDNVNLSFLTSISLMIAIGCCTLLFVRIDGLNKRGVGELFMKDFRKDLIKNESLSNNHI